MSEITRLLITANQFVVVALVITSFSMLLYSLTFNLRDRVAQAMNRLLACVTLVYLGDVLASVSIGKQVVSAALYCQWIGISMVPAAYLHFSDALLAKTGKPSRGRRIKLVFIVYTAGLIASVLALSSELIVHQIMDENGIKLLLPGRWFFLFVGGFLVITGVGLVNIYRAFLRCLTKVTKRRLGYLLLSSLAVPVGVFPYVMSVGGSISKSNMNLFWLAAIGVNVLISVAVVGMTYSVAFFGVTQPDRVIKGRLFQWILRGPIVASVTVGSYLFVRWFDSMVLTDLTLLVPVVVVVVLLLLQYVITVVRLPVERMFFYGKPSDRADVNRMQLLSEGLLTKDDLEKFMESVLGATCDILHISNGFVASVDSDVSTVEVQIGPKETLDISGQFLTTITSLINVTDENDILNPLGIIKNGSYLIIPLRTQNINNNSLNNPSLVGMIGLYSSFSIDEIYKLEEYASLAALVDRATMALQDRFLQFEVFKVMDKLLPEVEELQRMRAAVSYKGAAVLTTNYLDDPDAVSWVKGALGHYWGGPRLSSSPLMKLRIVEGEKSRHHGNSVLALRSILKSAIEDLRPEGQRKFTIEWLLYNILELKFLQGLKVREIATKLAVSEADYYRKQRVAINEVLERIVERESESDFNVVDTN